MEGNSMVAPIRLGPAARLALVTMCGTVVAAGCALIQPPPVPPVPRLGMRAGAGTPSCAAGIARAHAALAAAGAAAGDPAATAAAHATAAEAMSMYHACLAQPSRP
jgi:hypothetical protein